MKQNRSIPDNVMQLVVVWGKLAKSPNSRQILQIQDHK